MRTSTAGIYVTFNMAGRKSLKLFKTFIEKILHVSCQASRCSMRFKNKHVKLIIGSQMDLLDLRISLGLEGDPGMGWNTYFRCLPRKFIFNLSTTLSEWLKNPTLTAPSIGIYKKTANCPLRCRSFHYKLTSENIANGDLNQHDIFIYYPSNVVETREEYRLQSGKV